MDENADTDAGPLTPDAGLEFVHRGYLVWNAILSILTIAGVIITVLALFLLIAEGPELESAHFLSTAIVVLIPLWIATAVSIIGVARLRRGFKNSTRLAWLAAMAVADAILIAWYLFLWRLAGLTSDLILGRGPVGATIWAMSALFALRLAFDIVSIYVVTRPSSNRGHR